MIQLQNFPNYLITNTGQVFSTKGKKIRQLKYVINVHGYCCVTFSCNSKLTNQRVHRLVAETFIPNPNNLPNVNHIDGNKLNNEVSNLEWCNTQHNTIHAYNNVQNHKSRARKLTLVDVNNIRLDYASGNYTHIGLGEKYNIHPTHIGRIINKKCWI